MSVSLEVIGCFKPIPVTTPTICTLSFSDIKSKINRDVFSSWVELDQYVGLTNPNENVLEGSVISNNSTLFFHCANCTCSNSKMKCKIDSICSKYFILSHDFKILIIVVLT